MLTQAPTLETARLRLRQLTLDDYAALVACWASPDTVRYIGSGQPQDSEMSWGRLLRYIGHWQLLGYGYWAVCEKDSGLLIGTVGIQNQKRNLTPALEYPEAGWTLSPTATGQGFATEALTAVLTWADSTFAGPVCCIIDDENQPSIRLAERMGFRFRHYVEYHNKKVRMLVRPSAD
ncbi:GNAT family N-acetyltransferase [Klebsiella sp. BIGb0407]|uniref:GNAT family N-acetyltransferase n=1 Tax=Klebsiella sp. BIGb0407 TaxID=2940603 RepID=UPI0021687FFD|nr:GNAT family N-acetyltransferase [Klebsiella sp. BIGb0407]MCS3430399.1 RimJ/RimL family protein N-acetyltransferase [Klebsiella sp. BIGb0407]